MGESKPLTMWAIIVDSPRASWIYHASVRRTRKEAKAAYLDGVEPAYYRNMLEGTRLVRVTVQEQTP